MNTFIKYKTNIQKYKVLNSNLKSNGLLFLFFIIVNVFVFNNYTNSKSLQKISVKPNNRISVYLDENLTYFSNLSDDKQKIELEFSSVFFQDNLKDIIVNNGLISSISTFNREQNTIIGVNLSTQLGYTANFLPYSKSIMLEVFDWKQLKPSEDAYRNGLLALESGLIDDAISQFTTATQLKSANGSAILGLTQLQNNMEYEGYKNLVYAFENKSDIPDVYAALAQIYKYKNETQTANKFSKIFSNLTGIIYFEDLPLNLDSISLINNLNLNYLEEFIVESANIDTTNINTPIIIDSTKIKDSLNALKSAQSDVFIPKDFFKYLGAMLLITIGVFMIIMLSKRKKKEKILNVKDKFKSSLNNAINEIDPEKFQKQKEVRRNLFIKKKGIEKQHKNANTKPKTNIYPKEPTIDLNKIKKVDKNNFVENIEIENNTEKLQSYLETLIEVKKREEEQLQSIKSNKAIQNKEKRKYRENFSYKDIKHSDEPRTIDRSNKIEVTNQEVNTILNISDLPDAKLDPKADLAVRLAQKQKEIQEQKLKEMSNNNESSSQFETFAKNKSIEKSGLETQQNINSLNNDSEKLKNLADKFKIDAED
jgi:hypothetical protein